MLIQLIVWFSILILRISFSLLSTHGLASSSLETGVCSVFYSSTRAFTKTVAFSELHSRYYQDAFIRSGAKAGRNFQACSNCPSILDCMSIMSAVCLSALWY